MKHAFRLSRVAAALLLLAFVVGAFVSSSRVPTSQAQSAALAPTPDHFVVQITRTTIPFVATPTPSPTATPSPSPSPTATPAPGSPIPRNSFATAISDDGRFVVIESNGDIATPGAGQTEAEKSPHNRDGNQEIFLFDYAQRRIFQLTDTRHALKNADASPVDPANIDVLITNHHASISRNGRYVVFGSNAYSDASPGVTPKSFNAQNHVAALKADGNAEVFYYPLPEAPAADLSAGEEAAPFNPAAGTPVRVTFTPATALPRPGTATVAPFFADDNRPNDVNDDGSYVAFVTEARTGLAGVSNTDGNPEVVVFNRDGGFTQITSTADVDPIFGPFVFNDNPSISGGGGTVRIAFVSNADINTTEAEADRRNGEIHVATYTGSGLAPQTCPGVAAAVTGPCPVTKTPPERRTGFEGINVNVFNPGRRLSRDGNFLLFESTGVFNRDGSLSGALASTYGIYLYNIGANQFTQVAERVPNTENADLPNRFPTFTGDGTRVVWGSSINYRANGTVAATGSNEGLNPSRGAQIFTAPVEQLAAATPVNQLSRLTNQPILTTLQPLPSNTVRRMAFSLFGAFQFGEGNADGLSEALYVLVPAVTSETPAPSPSPAASPADVRFFTGATLRPVVAASPAPSPSPGEAVTSLAAGELSVARSTLALAPSERQVSGGAADEVRRRPTLPVELNGVSVSVNNAAAGLYSVGPNQINFVIPPAVATNSTAPLPVVINNNGAVIRTSLLVTPAQPDIGSSVTGSGGPAVFNATNTCTDPTPGPFTLFSRNICSAQNELVPTRLMIILTGVRNATASQITVRIRETDITGANIISVGPTGTPGFDQIIIQLPDNAALIGADSPVIVTVAGASSRPAATAPRITITAREP